MGDPPRSDRDDPPRERRPAPRDPASVAADPELPVVARLVVEVRSDGSRTVTRGAIEDVLSGETVAVEARADSPLELSMNLAKMLLQAPALASQGLRAGLPTPADLRKAARRRLGRLGKRLRSRLRGDDPDARDD
ncbi:MAG: hypothetical protein R3A79_30165 [Nannocystaceae bacterium]